MIQETRRFTTLDDADAFLREQVLHGSVMVDYDRRSQEWVITSITQQGGRHAADDV